LKKDAYLFDLIEGGSQGEKSFLFWGGGGFGGNREKKGHRRISLSPEKRKVRGGQHGVGGTCRGKKSSAKNQTRGKAKRGLERREREKDLGEKL